MVSEKQILRSAQDDKEQILRSAQDDREALAQMTSTFTHGCVVPKAFVRARCVWKVALFTEGSAYVALPARVSPRCSSWALLDDGGHERAGTLLSALASKDSC